MYIDPKTEQGEMVGRYYIFKEELKTLCCSKTFQAGEVVRVLRYTSKNRLLISDKGSLHKVKKSSLNRTAEEFVDD